MKFIFFLKSCLLFAVVFLLDMQLHEGRFLEAGAWGKIFDPLPVAEKMASRKQADAWCSSQTIIEEGMHSLTRTVRIKYILL